VGAGCVAAAGCAFAGGSADQAEKETAVARAARNVDFMRDYLRGKAPR